MSLIKCIECGHDASSGATACPHCGCQLTEKSSRPDDDAKKQVDQKKLGFMVACIIVGLLCIMVAIILIVVMTNASAAQEAKDFFEKLKHEKLNPSD